MPTFYYEQMMDDHTCAVVSDCATTAGTWVSWCSRYSEASTTGYITYEFQAAQSAAWRVWVLSDNVSTTSAEYSRNMHPVPQRAISEEEREQLREQSQRDNEARLQRYAEERRLIAEAQQLMTEQLAVTTAKSKELLEQYLSDEQREEHNIFGNFHVIGQDGTRFRVETRRTGNVVEVNEDNEAVARYCLHAVAPVPVYDDMLIALLMLKHDLENYRRIANKTEIRRVGPSRRAVRLPRYAMHEEQPAAQEPQPA